MIFDDYIFIVAASVAQISVSASLRFFPIYVVSFIDEKEKWEKQRKKIQERYTDSIQLLRILILHVFSLLKFLSRFGFEKKTLA